MFGLLRVRIIDFDMSEDYFHDDYDDVGDDDENDYVSDVDDPDQDTQ